MPVVADHPDVALAIRDAGRREVERVRSLAPATGEHVRESRRVVYLSVVLNDAPDASAASTGPVNRLQHWAGVKPEIVVVLRTRFVRASTSEIVAPLL